MWILVENTSIFFFRSKSILVDFCLTFQTEDSKPFPIRLCFRIFVQHTLCVWIVMIFFKIKFLFFFWPLDFLTLFSIFVASLAAPISNRLPNISAGMPCRNLNGQIQHTQAEFISLICLNLLLPLYSLSIVLMTES